MPRYYFNVRDGIQLITDHVGLVLPDMDAAIEEAALVVAGFKNQTDLLKDLKITIFDEKGQLLEKVNLPDPSEVTT